MRHGASPRGARPIARLIPRCRNKGVDPARTRITSFGAQIHGAALDYDVRPGISAAVTILRLIAGAATVKDSRPDSASVALTVVAITIL
jgi:hypothetical protein